VLCLEIIIEFFFSLKYWQSISYIIYFFNLLKNLLNLFLERASLR